MAGYDMMTIIDAASQQGSHWPGRAGVGMATCKGGCGGYTESKTGYCSMTSACLRKQAEVRGLKKCKRCHGPIQLRNSTGYCQQTEACRQAYKHAHYQATIIHSLAVGARQRAEAKGVPFTITEQDIENVWVEVCPVFNKSLQSNHKTGPWSPTLDRVDPTKGYIPGNIQVISHLANSMKRNASPEELLQFADWAYATYGNGRT